jgi:Uma2 family endonuclease
MTKLREYRAWGVGFIWVIDPDNREIHLYDNGNLIVVDALVIPSHNFSLPAAEIFA